MRQRITDAMLHAQCQQLNRATGNPETPWTATTNTGTLRANVGNYHISHAYGGVNLHQMSNEDGGVSTPLGLGHRPKRELYEQMRAFLDGIEAGRRSARA